MTPPFADTFYYLALLSADDAAHDPAVEVSRTRSGSTVTTAFVLAEVLDGLCAVARRQAAVLFVEHLRQNPT